MAPVPITRLALLAVLAGGGWRARWSRVGEAVGALY